MTNTIAQNSIAVLLVEGNMVDAARIEKTIAESQSAVHQPISILLNHVKALREARNYLNGSCHCDVVLFDMSLPDSEGLDTIGPMSSYAAAFPTIVLMELGDLAPAVEALKRGAQDCLVKSAITPKLLSRAIYYAAERFKVLKKERENSITDLQKTLAKIKKLNGVIPICMHCKQIRNDKGCWEQWEGYIRLHFHVSFSHGICPECAKTIYGLDEDSRDGCKTQAVNIPALACGHPSMKRV